MGEPKSSSSPLFLQSAQDLAARLGAHQGDVAHALTQEARDLVALFQTWEKARPTDDQRIAGIQRLFELNRRAMDFLARQTKTTRRTDI